MSTAGVVEPRVMVEATRAAPAQRWCIITCEYPPVMGGVSDHTFLLSRALVAAGDTVDVWTPAGPAAPPPLDGVSVHLLPSLFGFDALLELYRMFRSLPDETRVLVQYVPTGYGMRMLNVPFALLLFLQRRRGIDIYFHEVGFPIRRTERLRRNAGGIIHLLMAWLAVRAARRVFVAIPEWQRRLRRLGIREADSERVVTWIPVPSNVPAEADPERVGAIRERLLRDRYEFIVGHFGTFGRYHLTVLRPTFERILDEGSERVALLVGRGSIALRDALVAGRPDLADRIVATGGLEPSEVSAHISSCDVLVQPFDDGVSARRTSLMAGLALGRPVITNRGSSSGTVWAMRRSVYLTESDEPADLAQAVRALLDDPEQRESLGRGGCALHADLFAMARGVARLRNTTSAPEPLPRDARVSVARPILPTAALTAAVAGMTTGGPTPAIPPRILMLHTTLPEPGRKLGGVEVAVHRLANALVDLGAPVTVASLTAAPADARYARRTLFGALPWLHTSRFGRLVVLPLLLNALRLDDAEVVHFHGDDWFVLRRPRATVRTLHGSALREAQRATRPGRRILQYLVYPLERLAARLATTAVAVGEDTAVLHGIRTVIGHGVDAALFHPGVKSPTARVLYVGTWEGRKRGRWLYELFVDQIAPRHPDVELHFIGDVVPPMHARVRFEEFPDDEALARAYREAWVFALPSTYEGFGIPYLEAMASGTAVLATPNPGAVELLGNGRFGVLADDTVFADALLRLLDTHDVRDRLAAAGLERSREFTWPKVATAYLAVYAQAIRQRAGQDVAESSGARDGVVRELPSRTASMRRRRTGPFRGLWLESDEGRAARWRRDVRARDHNRWLVRFLADAGALIDVGAGAGQAMLYALAQPTIMRVLAFEPDRVRRDALRRMLAPNGMASDPRLTLSGLAIGRDADDETATLDDQLPELRWPLVVRLAAPSAVDAVLAGGARLLAQDSVRWLIALTPETRERYDDLFHESGYLVRHLGAGWFGSAPGWLAAWREDEGLGSK